MMSKSLYLADETVLHLDQQREVPPHRLVVKGLGVRDHPGPLVNLEERGVLQPQIGHNIRVQAPIICQSAPDQHMHMHQVGRSIRRVCGGAELTNAWSQRRIASTKSAPDQHGPQVEHGPRRVLGGIVLKTS